MLTCLRAESKEMDAGTGSNLNTSWFGVRFLESDNCNTSPRVVKWERISSRHGRCINERPGQESLSCQVTFPAVDDMVLPRFIKQDLYRRPVTRINLPYDFGRE